MGRQCTMSLDQENELCSVLQEMESRLYGLSTLDVRKTVYQFCALNKLPNSFNEEKKFACRKWLPSRRCTSELVYPANLDTGEAVRTAFEATASE